MTNRQARREQRRSQRGGRAQRGGQRPASKKQQPSAAGGPGSFFSLPYLIGIGALVVILGAALIFVSTRGDSDEEFVEMLQAAHAQFPDELADGLAVGDPDAPIIVQSYIDFRCPFCMQFAADQEPQLIEEFVEAGLVRIETRHLPVLGNESVIAAEAAQCAVRQGRGWDMHNKLFQEQVRQGTGTGSFNRDAVKSYARDIGLDTEEFDQCVDTNATIDEVQDDRAEAQSYGFTGTPSFLVNGMPISGAVGSMEGWREIFEELLGDVEAGGEAGAGNGIEIELDDDETGETSDPGDDAGSE